jgi:hypothetical protein
MPIQVAADFNRNAINAKINSVIKQIEEIVEFHHNLMGGPDATPDVVKRGRPANKSVLALMDYLDQVVSARDDLLYVCNSYVDEIKSRLSDADDSIADYVKPKLASINQK